MHYPERSEWRVIFSLRTTRRSGHCASGAYREKQSMLRRGGDDQRKLVGDCACAIFVLNIKKIAHKRSLTSELV